MSEQFTPRSSNWDEKQAAHEAAKFEDAVYGKAGKTDFSDKAKSRAIEGDEYMRHMSELADRSDDYDPITADLPDATERVIQKSAELRRAAKLADEIREMGSSMAEANTIDRKSQRYQDKQDKLQELLLAYDEKSSDDGYTKQDVINSIIDRTSAPIPEAEKHSESKDEEAGEVSTPVVEDSTDDALEPESDIVTETTKLLPDAEAVLDDPNVSDEQKDKIRAAIAGIVSEIDGETPEGKASDAELTPADQSSDETDSAKAENAPDAGDASPLQLESTEAVLARSDISDERKDEILQDLSRNKKRKFGSKVLDAARTAYATVGAYAGTRLNQGTMKLVEKYEGTSRRRRIMMGAAALAAAGSLVLLSRNNWGFGQDVMEQAGNAAGNGGGTGGNIPKLEGSGNSIVETVAASGFKVEKNHGYTQELMELGKSLGHKKMSPDQSYELYKALSSEHGKDFIDIGKNGKDIYTMANGDTGLAQSGNAKWAKGVVEFADKWMTRRGL